MFIIKAKNKKFVYREEDKHYISFNLVNDVMAATQFSTRKEAEEVKNEIIDNAEQELLFIDSLTLNAATTLEYESIGTQFVNLTIVEVK